MMESEVRFALLSRVPDFPITVPRCYFADFQQATGTGLLITERIVFGANGVEPHYPKCLDYEMPEPLEHYRALVRSLARLAGTHKAGRFPSSIEREFPFDKEALIASDRIRYNARQLQNRVLRYADFAAEYSRLLPQNISAPTFISQLARDIPRFLERESALREFLYAKHEFVALCHWNANIDNAWFWRGTDGLLECGLLDWGRVGQISVAQALYGSLSGAEPEIWSDCLDELLTLFVAEFEASGGPRLEVQELNQHLALVTALMGIAYLLDAPPLLLAEIPDLAQAESCFDPRFKANEMGRMWLHMLTMFMNNWQTQKFGAILDDVLRVLA
jgi:hypothetical protein